MNRFLIDVRFRILWGENFHTRVTPLFGGVSPPQNGFNLLIRKRLQISKKVLLRKLSLQKDLFNKTQFM